jgi:hypothetical protein
VATQLEIFNGALLLLKTGPISQTELTNGSVEKARILNAAWTGATKRCLEMGLWKFAMRTVLIDSSSSVTPAFGHQFAFDHPTDYVRTNAVCSDEFLRCPLLDYSGDEGAFWYASIDPIYVQYVSSDAAYGGDLSLWSASFQAYVEAYIAHRAAGALKGDTEDLARTVSTTLKTALSKNAMNGPPKTLPMGSWNAARLSGSYRRDGGSRTEF